ncbi:MAG: hypothetical protein ACRD4E_17470, partial [Bryobacteraceae bacterium]
MTSAIRAGMIWPGDMFASAFTPALFLATGLSSVVKDFSYALTDDTFKGIHRLVFFDWAMMVPYFSFLIVLSLYGLHRYETIRGYLKHRARFPEEPPRRFERLPRVTIQLPIYNEQYVV